MFHATQKMKLTFSLGFTVRMLLLEVPKEAHSLKVKVHLNHLQDVKATVTCDEKTYPVEFVPVTEHGIPGEVWIGYGKGEKCTSQLEK